MASLRDIRNRIRSVKNTQKITNAMKLVAAAKLRKAQNSIISVRPYAIELEQLLYRVASTLYHEKGRAPHPLLEKRVPKRVLLLVLTSDNGLCGSFNSNILKQADLFLKDNKDKFEKIEIKTMGRRGYDYFSKNNMPYLSDFPNIFSDLSFRSTFNISSELSSNYAENNLDAIYVLYNEFQSAMTQNTVLKSLLPIDSIDVVKNIPTKEYIYEPTHKNVLDKLVSRYMAIQIWRFLLESFASEHGARMTAMENASNNARDLVADLSLKYNRARQAAITGELMEIIGGAEALKG